MRRGSNVCRTIPLFHECGSIIRITILWGTVSEFKFGWFSPASAKASTSLGGLVPHWATINTCVQVWQMKRCRYKCLQRKQFLVNVFDPGLSSYQRVPGAGLRKSRGYQFSHSPLYTTTEYCLAKLGAGHKIDTLVKFPGDTLLQILGVLRTLYNTL